MDIGLMMIFASYGWENMSDDQVWNEDLRLARRAATAPEIQLRRAYLRPRVERGFGGAPRTASSGNWRRGAG